MADTVLPTTRYTNDTATIPVLSQPPSKLSRRWEQLALGIVMLLSICMNFFRLGQGDYGNLYYAAGVRSMTDSWHTFFFASFDPAGFVTLDKPPLGFWLQTLSAMTFGFTPFSLFFPQALCGVLTVFLLYYLVRRHFGAAAGLVAALVLAVTPISVVTNRNNTIDGTLALFLVLAAWAVIHAAEKGKLRWLLLSGVFVGLGFNVKMAEAFLVVPALGLTYFLCASRTLWTRIWHLSLALLAMLLLSLSWITAVDLIPAAQRPYVGSTQDNSALSLASGYNGLNRIHIGIFGIGASGTGTSKIPSPFSLAFFQPSSVGPLHLFSASLGGQIAWLLPFAVFGLIALAWIAWKRHARTQQGQQEQQLIGLVLWGSWFLTMATFFSLNPRFQPYYMTEMAPGLSALVGSGLVVMWRSYQNGSRASWRRWLLPLALIATAVGQLFLLAHYPSYAYQISPMICAVMVGTVTGLLLLRIPFFMIIETQTRLYMSKLLVGLALCALLVTPTIWSGYSVLYNLESPFPTAGPSTYASATTFIGPRNILGQALEPSPNVLLRTIPHTVLLAYLRAHQGKTTFLVATSSAKTAEPFILSLNKPVMALGGYSGKDPIVTISGLKALLRKNAVRFFLLDPIPSTPVSSWISGSCTVIPPMQWNYTQTSSLTLFDCATSSSRQTQHS